MVQSLIIIVTIIIITEKGGEEERSGSSNSQKYVYETNKKYSKNKQLPIITSKINWNQIYIL